jgi:hypothetical protein
VLRALLALAGVVGAAALAASTWATVIQIKVLTTARLAGGLDTHLSGGDRHGVAFIVIAAFALLMLAGALRGARPAMAAVAAAGILSLVIAVTSDASHIHDTGQVGQLYEDASAGAGAGFYEETLGGALLLVAGGGLLLLSGAGPRRPRAERPARGRRDDAAAPDQADAGAQGAGRKADDWFSA